jgi:hypothetical protein
MFRGGGHDVKFLGYDLRLDGLVNGLFGIVFARKPLRLYQQIFSDVRSLYRGRNSTSFAKRKLVR